jgi:hypothetical protein
MGILLEVWPHQARYPNAGGVVAAEARLGCGIGQVERREASCRSHRLRRFVPLSVTTRTV